MRIVLFSALIFFSQVLAAQNSRDSLSIELERIIAHSAIPGLGVSIIGENDILYSKGFGYRDIQTKRLYDSLTIQSVASISKTMIAISLMKMVEQGRLNLEEDINTYLPFKVVNPNFLQRKITLLQLATHTSSIIESDQADDGSYFIHEREVSKKSFPKGHYKYYKRYRGNPNLSIGDYLERYLAVDGQKFKKNIFGNYAPGTAYSYSNIASTLVAYIIEIVSGQTFESFTEEHIFRSLNMESTTWKRPMNNNVSQQYFHNGSKVPDYTLITFPSGDLQTNSFDMAKFMLEMMKGYMGKGRLLKPESYTYMFTNRLNLRKTNQLRGIFWEIGPEGNIGHGGAEIGTTCQVIFSPALKKSFFLMINMTVYDQAHLEQDYRDLLITISKYAKSM